MISIGIIAYILAFTSIACWRFSYCLTFLVSILPLYIVRTGLGPLPSTLLEISILILFVAWCMENKVWQKEFFLGLWAKYGADKIQKALWVTLVLFLLSATVSIITASNHWAALGEWRAYFLEPALVFLMLITTFKSTRDISKTIIAALVSGAVIASIAWYQKFTGWNIPDLWFAERRVTSLYPYPNAVGLYLAPMVPLIIAGWWYVQGMAKAWWQKVGAWILGALLVALFIGAIYFAKTESAIVALAVALSVMGLIASVKTRVSVITAWVVGGIALYVSHPLAAFVQEKLLLKDWSGQVRLTTWGETIPMLRDHWLTGAGLAGYQTLFAPYHHAKYIEIFLFPHNIFLNFWSEIGIYGLVSAALVGVVVFVMTTLALKKYWAEEKSWMRLLVIGLLGSMITILVHGLVDAPYFKNDLAVQCWWLLALVVVVYADGRNTTTVEDKNEG